MTWILSRKETLMKKLISVLLVLALCCLMIPALAEEDVTGEWYGPYFSMAFTLTLNEDGTFTLDALPAGQRAGEGTWTRDGDRMTLVVPDIDAPADGVVADGVPAESMMAEGTLADGTLTLSLDGQTVAFTREPVEVFTPAEVNPEAAVEDFNGLWDVAYIASGVLFAAASEDNADSFVLENGTLTLADPEHGSLALWIGAEPIALEYADGALTYTLEISMGDAAITLVLKAEMLQDGMLALSMDTGYGATVSYMVKRVVEE